MDLVDLDLCVVLPVSCLDAWVRADPETRAAWLSGVGPVSPLTVAEHAGFVFRRDRPRPTKPLVVVEPRRRVAIVVTGSAEAAVRRAIDEPAQATPLAARVHVPSALLVMGGDLAHADIAGGTPVAGPHRMVDLLPGSYRVELRAVGAPGDPASAQVIVYDRLDG
jgi:hypothetical protein